MTKKAKRKDVYKTVTDKLIDLMSKGVNPWQKGWQNINDYGSPYSLLTGKQYKGFNRTYLSAVNDSGCNGWITYNGCKKLGGQVKKGSKAETVIHWNFTEIQVKDADRNPVFNDDGTKKMKKAVFVNGFAVFNALKDCEGLENHVKKIEDKVEIEESKPHDSLTKYLKREKIELKHNGGRAFYCPMDDSIGMPHEQTFIDAIEYQNTLAHECIHSTGHKSRLDRFKQNDLAFNSGEKSYSYEELVAEIGSVQVISALGLEPKFDNSASYLKGWASNLSDNIKWAVQAASAAEKASNYIFDGKGAS
jgi:antirestriction protein ArdC